MKKRPSARLLVLDAEHRILLFKFSFDDDVIAHRDFWATPGGALEDGETFTQAAARELFEETGISTSIGEPVKQRVVHFQTPPKGEWVEADERYFIVRVDRPDVRYDGHQLLEVRHMRSHRWWTVAELQSTPETVFPDDLALWVDALISSETPR